MIKNIIFDMGGVLIEFNPDHLLNCVTNNEKDKQILMKYIFASKEWKMMDQGLIDEPEMFEIVSSRIPSYLHDKAYYLIFRWNEIAYKYLEVSEYIRELKDRGYKLFMLSNASRRLLNEYFANIEAHECFDGVIVSAFVNMLKPNRNIYEYLLNEFKLKAEECVFIDDYDKNVYAAIECGMEGIIHDKGIIELRENLEAVLSK